MVGKIDCFIIFYHLDKKMQTITAEFSAPTFYRVIDCIQQMTYWEQSYKFTFLEKLLKTKERATEHDNSPWLDILIGMVHVTEMNMGVPAIFPTSDTEVLGKILLHIVRLYDNNPEIMPTVSRDLDNTLETKIATGKYVGARLEQSKIRNLENALLNAQFGLMGKLIFEKEDIKVAVEFIEPFADQGTFHSERQYVRLTIQETYGFPNPSLN
jgi:hypothetical protein